MTHAALKDQKARAVVWTNNCTCHPETCCCAPFKVKVDGKYLIAGTEEACATVAAAINAAALSAVEGEAVAWPNDRTHLFTDAMDDAVVAFMGSKHGITRNSENASEHVDPEIVLRRSLVEAMIAYRKAESRTAPPPQQAAERSAMLAGLERESQEAWMLPPNTVVVEWEKVAALATQPQQAGGDVVQRVLDKVVASVMGQREEILRAFVAKHGLQPDEAVQIVGTDGSWRVIRREDMYQPTPPQPEAGGGVTEAMVERAALALWEFDPDPRHWSQVSVATHDHYMDKARTALTAALSTTTASGGEHGR